MRRKKWHGNGKGSWLLTVRHYETQHLKMSIFDITASILLNRRECGIAELQEMGRGTPKGIASF
jgi:hypothetical protein